MSFEMEEARSLTARVEGWLQDCEGELLFNLARGCEGRGAIVEVGSWKGKSTIWLGRGSLAGKKAHVWAVDPHTGSGEHHEAFGSVWTFDEFKKNVTESGLDEVVTPIVKTSEEAALSFREPVELVFIDGAHDYESARRDFELWSPKVVDGGIVALHDTTCGEGPRRVVVESLCGSQRFRGVHLVGSIAYARKVERNSPVDRIKNGAAAYAIGSTASTPCFLPKPIKALGRRFVKAMGIL